MIDLIKPWKDFLKPWEEVKNTKGSIVEGIVYAEIGALVYAVLSILLNAEALSKIATLLNLGNPLLFLPVILILAPISLIINSGILYIIAKLFGGKGDFELQTFRFGYFGYPIVIINSIPIINIFAALWALLISFFIIKETHKVSDLRAIAVILVPIVIAIIIGIIIAISIISSLVAY
jgi:hypothetical protein